MKRLITLAAFALLGVTLPLAGAYVAGRPLAPFLQLSRDRTPAVAASFEWPAFLIYALIILAVVGPFVWRTATARLPRTATPVRPHAFPWWGWAGFVLTTLTWTLAWSRMPAFEPFQAYTYTPLWLGYILIANGLTYRETGHCLLRDRPGCFLLLFPASAAAWWYFEFLNRFVGNWYYVGLELITPREYLIHASISFSTVLPAIVCTRDWLATSPRLDIGLRNFWSAPVADARVLPPALLILGALGFVALGAWPQHFYSMVWLAPLLVIVALQALAGLPNLLPAIRRGDWRPVGLPALAALTAGFFWELWNWKSLAHWEYVIPLVDRFHLFEMPILGYAGYLPFGVVCVIISELVCGYSRNTHAYQTGA